MSKTAPIVPLLGHRPASVVVWLRRAKVRASGPRRRPARAFAAFLISAAVLTTLVAAAQAARDDLALVSRQSGAAGAAADGSSLPASISADGRFVVFFSDADNLSGEDGDPTPTSSCATCGRMP